MNCNKHVVRHAYLCTLETSFYKSCCFVSLCCSRLNLKIKFEKELSKLEFGISLPQALSGGSLTTFRQYLRGTYIGPSNRISTVAEQGLEIGRVSTASKTRTVRGTVGQRASNSGCVQQSSGDSPHQQLLSQSCTSRTTSLSLNSHGS